MTPPAFVPDLEDVVQIHAKGWHSCALTGSGRVYCWGLNDHGQLGNERPGEGAQSPNPTPGPVYQLDDAVEILGGGPRFTCAKRRSGVVSCWGQNESGQLLDGGTDHRTLPTTLSAAVTFDAIDGEFSNACGLSNGRVFCWGARSGGKLRDTEHRDVVELASGEAHTCVRLSTGDVRCFGDVGARGLLGTANGVVSLTEPAVRIAAGAHTTCAILRSGQVACWGDGAYGQQGSWTQLGASDPVPWVVPTVDGVDEIRVAGAFVCASRSGGPPECWGSSDVGQLGAGPWAHRLPPTRAPVDGVRQLSAGWEHACARLDDGRTLCWGANHYGALGTGAITARVDEPAEVASLGDVRQISTRSRHSCALRADGAVACWGNNEYGQVGTSTITRIAVAPIVVGGLDSAVAVATSPMAHSCAITGPQRSVWCWGLNDGDQLGSPTDPKMSHEPMRVPGIAGAVEVALGSTHTCARTRSDRVHCWGSNERGQTGSSDAARREMHEVGGLGSVTRLAAGCAFNCAQTRDARLICWGDNHAGQLGRGEIYRSSHEPEAISYGAAVRHFDSSCQHSCLVMDGGEVACWGQEYNSGRLGPGVFGDQALPQLVAGVTATASVAVGWGHSCAVDRSGQVLCWGTNDFGQITGLGPFSLEPIPIASPR